MVNGKAMGLDKLSDELPVELLKVGFSDSSHESLLAFHGIIVALWMTGIIPQDRSGKMQPSKFYTRRRIELSVATAGASLWWRMLTRFSSKSWPVDLTTSARKLGLFPRNSAASDHNA